jgi:DNA-directed RNA polymerase specialized sigma24 family protein
MAVVGRYLSLLPADLQRVHDALFVQGLSQRDAAIALGLGRQVVRTLASRLREGLRSALKDGGQLDLLDGVAPLAWTQPYSKEKAR